MRVDPVAMNESTFYKNHFPRKKRLQPFFLLCRKNRTEQKEKSRKESKSECESETVGIWFFLMSNELRVNRQRRFTIYNRNGGRREPKNKN